MVRRTVWFFVLCGFLLVARPAEAGRLFAEGFGGLAVIFPVVAGARVGGQIHAGTRQTLDVEATYMRVASVAHSFGGRYAPSAPADNIYLVGIQSRTVERDGGGYLLSGISLGVDRGVETTLLANAEFGGGIARTLAERHKAMVELRL